MSNALKFLLLAAGCGLVILLITVAVLTAQKGKADIDSNVGQYSNTASEYEDVDLKAYDGTIVLGKEVKRIIEMYNSDDYLSIVVDTSRGSSTSYINACTLSGLTITANTGTDYTAIPTTKSNADYINNSGEFLCTVHYDANGIVTCLWFTQQ
jgi:hypothetical protein